MSFWTWLLGEKESDTPAAPTEETYETHDLTATIIYNFNGKQVEEVQYFQAYTFEFWNETTAVMNGTDSFNDWLDKAKETSFLKFATETKGFKKLIPLSSVLKITTETKARKIIVKL